MSEVSMGMGEEMGMGKRKAKKEKKEKEVFAEGGGMEEKLEQSKFFVDLSKDKKTLERVLNLLTKVNDKNYGRDILFKDLVVYAVEGLNEKDLEKIKDNSLSEMERVQRHLDDYNQKNGTSLSMGEWLIKKLGLN